MDCAWLLFTLGRSHARWHDARLDGVSFALTLNR